jgi:hypothetical protein
MTKSGALYTFWAGFGIPAFEENSVPEGAEFPYITYESGLDGFGGEMLLSGSVWYRSTSWVDANAKAEEIGGALGYGGMRIPCTGGRLWIRRGSPSARASGDPDDDLIRRMIINIEVMFLTTI